MPNIQQPPRAKKVEHITEMHGHTLIDNYHGIKTEGLQSSDVQQLITAENAYADSVLSRTKALKDKIFLEMLDRKFIDPHTTEEEEPAEIEYTQIGDWFYGSGKTKNELYNGSSDDLSTNLNFQAQSVVTTFFNNIHNTLGY